MNQSLSEGLVRFEMHVDVVFREIYPIFSHTPTTFFLPDLFCGVFSQIETKVASTQYRIKVKNTHLNVTFNVFSFK